MTYWRVETEDVHCESCGRPAYSYYTDCCNTLSCDRDDCVTIAFSDIIAISDITPTRTRTLYFYDEDILGEATSDPLHFYDEAAFTEWLAIRR